MEYYQQPLTDIAVFFRQYFQQNQIFSGGLLIMLIGTIVASFHSLYGIIKDRIYRYFVVSMTISNSVACYSWFLDWLNDRKFNLESKNLKATVWYGNSQTQGYRNNQGINPTILFAPGDGNHIFKYKGTYIWMRKSVDPSPSLNLEVKENITLSAISRSTVILQELMKEVEQFHINKSAGTPIFVPQGDMWHRAFSRAIRPLSTVILEEGVSQEIVSDVKDFLESQEWYRSRGLPYRRGYLFYGPPGGGKSSFLVALAGELNLNVCSLSLSDATFSDTSLLRLFRMLPARAAVLLEDVDCIFVERSSADKRTGVTFSGLLNAIDGVAASEGRLLFLTTNHKEKLEPALIRPGRVDKQVCFDHASTFQMERLFRNFFPEEDHEMARQFSSKIPSKTFSMAALQGYLLKHRRNPKEAIIHAHELSNKEAEPFVRAPKEQTQETKTKKDD